MSKSRLLKKWEKAKDNLGLSIVAPFEVDLGENVKIQAEFLVENFGDQNGMVIVTNYALVKPYLGRLQNLGYGFSVLDEPRDETGETYDRAVFIEMLSDWGWTGPEENKPAWVIESD